MKDWTNEKLDNLMDRYLFGLLDEATGGRVRRKIESDPEWQLAYEAAVARRKALVSGIRGGATESAAARAPKADDILPAARAADARQKTRRLIFRGTAGGVAAAAVIAVLGAWLYVAAIRPPTHHLRLLGQMDLMAGSVASLRAMVLPIGGGAPIPAIPVVLSLAGPDGATVELARWTTGPTGIATGRVNIPDVPAGDYALVATAPGLRTSPLTVPITIRRANKVYLVTDKPIYQPGQTVHMRTLVLRKPHLRPAGGSQATFTVTDPAGNVIFNQPVRLSDFGIASAEMPLDELINPGRYTIKISAGGDESVRTVEIFRYKLPAFAVRVTLDKPYYLPGQTISGKVAVRYHFGKPVTDAKVELELISREVTVPDTLRTQTITTDADGLAGFEIKLPRTLFGSRRTAGDAHLLLSARATDSAGQENTGYRTVPVSRRDIRLAVVAENGAVSRGVKTRVFVVASYPDGRPVAGIIDVKSLGVSLRTDAAGAVVFAARNVPDPLRISARDEAGRTGKIEISLPKATGDSMVLRTDKPIYAGGETVNVEVISPGAGEIFLDLIHDRQTVLTRTLTPTNGKATLAIDLPAGLSGTLRLRAFRLGKVGEWNGRNTLIVVRPAGGLNVAVTKDRAVYRPGRDAKLTFQVTDPDGKPTVAAISLAAVDEAVFSVAQAVPGLEATLLGLDMELLAPAIQTEGFTPALFPRSETYTRAAFAVAARFAGDRSVFFGRREREVLPAAGPGSVDVGNRDDVQDVHLRRKADAKQTASAVSHIAQIVFALMVLAVALHLWGGAIMVGRPRPSLILVLVMVFAVLFLASILTPGLHMARQSGEVPAPSESLAARALMKVMASLENDRNFQMNGLVLFTDGEDVPPTGESGESARLRTYFPETMLWRPEVITDENGRAELTVPLADSITTWRVSGSAVSMAGQLGVVDANVRVFQAFFVDVDAPLTLTRGDEVSVPLVLYNYSRGELTVSVRAEGSAGLKVLGEPSQTVALAPGQVRRTLVRVSAESIGNGLLTVRASAGGLADAIRRPIRIAPPGLPRAIAVNGTLVDGEQFVDLVIPRDAEPGSVAVRMKVFPSTFSELIDGLDNIFRMPHGCFEQTSSTTYPNVMALSYMKAAGIRSPEIVAKARRYIHLGYQRLLSFEVGGGGFSLYGRSPASVPLTAYGLMEFTDMSRVHNVDRELLTRTAKWLAARQRADGAWGGYLPMSRARGEGASLAMTAYVTWALAMHDPRDQAALRGADYVGRRIAGARDPHTLALCANALFAAGRRSAGIAAAGRLARMALQPERGQRYWSSAGAALSYGRGPSGDVETTALAVQALLHVPQHRALVNDALRWLAAARDPHGTWGSTQATVQALKALVAGAGTSAKRDRDAAITVTRDGSVLARAEITVAQSDVVHTVALAKLTQPGTYRLRVRNRDAAGMAYQFVVHYYSPAAAPAQPKTALAVNVQYDRTQLRTGGTVRARATVTNNSSGVAKMLLVDIGIPPGFAVRPAGLDKLVAAGKIERYAIAGQGVIVYLADLAPKRSLTIAFDMVARIPLAAVARPTTAYEYYQPETKTAAPGRKFQVD